MGLFPSWASALVSFLDGYTTSLLPLPNVHIKHACVCNPLDCSLPLSPPYESRSAQSHQIYKTNLFRVQKIVKYYSKPLPLNYHSGSMLLITLKGSFLSWLEITFSTPPHTHTIQISYNSTGFYSSNCPAMNSYLLLGGNSPSRLYIILILPSTFYFLPHSTASSSCTHLSNSVVQSLIHWAPSVCQVPA